MAFGNYSAWQYSKWVTNIARNMKQTEPAGSVKTAVIVFLKLIWNPVAETGTRPWLAQNFQQEAVMPDDDYVCDLDNQPPHVLVKVLEIVGRDLKKIPITNAEAGYANTLIAATSNRRYGTGPTFGSTSGSTVTIV